MRLADLDPRFVGAGGAGITRDGQPVPERVGVGLMCRCPCGGCDPDTNWLFVEFANPLDGGPPLDAVTPKWQRTGHTFETLTLTPSILRSREKGGCGWHGFITDGEVRTC